ncbi:hypothetical protein ACCI51_17555 [Microbulbifer echini]|uniref:Uncharacterized protein n=1 Tax=Microbulbifer echini TaxID=1529067 RepID=A0ABV4NT94_9GAMM
MAVRLYVVDNPDGMANEDIVSIPERLVWAGQDTILYPCLEQGTG